MSRESTVSRSLWWLADASSRMLDSNEREAVHGDLAESLETGGQALRNVLGLVIRRQLAVWRGWQPWVSLGTLPRNVWRSLWICALVAVAALLTQNLSWWMLRVWQVFPLRYPRLPSLMPYSVLGPTMYVLATTRCRRSQRREAVS
jgi:hypothetical protein